MPTIDEDYRYKNGLPMCRKCGIYVILNLVNGKRYFGSATQKGGILARLGGHRSTLRGGYHENSHLQAAWGKYEEEAFYFGVVETCSVDEAIGRETFWISVMETLDPEKGYNQALPGRSPMLGKTHSPKSCAQMSAKRKGIIPHAATAAAAIANRGRKRSKEICDKISAGHKSRGGFSDDHKAAIKTTHWSKGPNAAEIIARREATKKARGNAGRQYDERGRSEDVPGGSKKARERGDSAQ